MLMGLLADLRTYDDLRGPTGEDELDLCAGRSDGLLLARRALDGHHVTYVTSRSTSSSEMTLGRSRSI